MGCGITPIGMMQIFLCKHTYFVLGEIIGFFTDKLGKTVILKLTSKNMCDAFLKGVVTECQFLEANKPEDEAGWLLSCLFLFPWYLFV